MLGSFIESDVYRVMVGCRHREPLLEAIRRERINHDSVVRALRRESGEEVSVAVLFVDGLVLQKLALDPTLELLQTDNVSARLRAAPALLPKQPAALRVAYRATA